MNSNHKIVLKSRPNGMPVANNFESIDGPVRQPKAGELLVQNLLLSIDPYMRLLMKPERGYSAPVELGGVMEGRTVGRVLQSCDQTFREGDYVVGGGNWQEYCLMPAQTTRKLDPDEAPLSTALGVLGWPGLTAWIGITHYAEPKAGQTVVVSAPAGAVGSFAGQIAKLKECRVVGIAGGPTKCREVVDELGFDACVDHRESSLADKLAAACPAGVDINFENVGGPVLKASWPLLNEFARVLVCGLISEYSGPPSPGPDLDTLLFRRIRMEAFFILDHLGRTGEFLREVTPWVREGKVKYREEIVDGLENAPQALIDLFNGRNVGKMIVRIAT